ncbi:MAG: hypothetical protein HQK54_03355 [Oligoflexales bacterium]|nr:hypothetical protein [Oligoflexales bacterium]
MRRINSDFRKSGWGDKRGIPLLLWAILLLHIPIAAKGEVPQIPVQTEKGFRNKTWTFGLSGVQHSLKSGEGHSLLGTSTITQLGMGYISEKWYSNVTIDIISGPYRTYLFRGLNIDFSGTGFSAYLGYVAEDISIRGDSANYGFALGFSYRDIIGRSLDEEDVSDINKNKTDPGKEPRIDRYVMSITEFSLIPAIFFSKFKEGRLYDNRPDKLATRIEGYVLTIGYTTPISINYKVEYMHKNPYPEKKRGKLKGYALTVALNVFFGV